MSGESDLWAFAPDEAARFSQLSSDRFHRLIDSLLGRESTSKLVSFRDLVALRVMAKLRDDHGVSLQHLREVTSYLRKYSNRPWSSLEVGVAPKKKVCFKNPNTGRWEHADSSKQQIHPIAVAEIERELRKSVQQARSRQRTEYGQIVRTRGVLGSRPCFAGTRIPVDLVRDRLQSGVTERALLKDYPSLQHEDIEAARARKLAS